MSKKRKIRVHESTGNVFADLSLADADDLFAKSGLVHRIAYIIEKRKLTQVQAAALLDIDQPKISNLLRGRLEGFSTERLFRFLNALDQDVEIIIKQKARSSKHAEVRVLAA
jgi:predicted XRE-type DNA-binding protein